jgi:hypothetical protein
MDHRVVLHVGARPDDHLTEVGADHHPVPDRGVRLDDHVADQTAVGAIQASWCTGGLLPSNEYSGIGPQ